MKLEFLLVLIMINIKKYKWGTHVSTATLVTPDTIDENEDWAPKTNGTVTTEDLPF